MSSLAAPLTLEFGASRTAVLAAVERVADVLASAAGEAQTGGTLPERAWRALHDSGLFRLKAPRELGGLEADPVTQIEAFERTAYIDSSAGWTLFVGAGTLAVISGWLADAALPDFMIDGRLPRVTAGLVPSGKATRADGGYRLTGRWQFGSGCEHAEYFSGNAFIAGEDPPVVLGFAFPRSAVTIHGNWQVGGLKGTGSSDFSVTDLFVPDRRVYNGFGPAVRGGPLFRIGLPGLVSNEHAAFALGVARRALDEVTALAKSKSRGYVAPQGIAARGVFQYELGKNDMVLRAARANVIDAYATTWQAVLAGEAVSAGKQTDYVAPPCTRRTSRARFANSRSATPVRVRSSKGTLSNVACATSTPGHSTAWSTMRPTKRAGSSCWVSRTSLR